MVFFNYSTMQMAAKVVYYGPGLCGKTTNLHYIYSHTANDSRGEMVSLETETDRTLFFDLLPIDVGSIAGFKTRIQLYTVPGQVFYNTTRKLVLKGVDGVVFVADSQRAMTQANVDAFKNLEENLAEIGLTADAMPLVLQYNKRDLKDVLSVDELNASLNRGNWPAFEASALGGQGVFETLKGISKLTLLSLKKRLTRPGETIGPRATSILPPSQPAAAPAPPPAPQTAAPTPPAAPPRAAAPPPPAPSAIPLGPPTRPAAPPVAPPLSPPVAAAAPPAAPRAKTGQVDVLRELERLRSQTLRPTPPPPVRAAASPAGVQNGQVNGQREMSRDIQLTLKRADFKRARRFTLSLQVEDGDNRVVDAIRDLQVDLDNVQSLEKVLLRLNIALNAKE